jgi:hypothetical protein
LLKEWKLVLVINKRGYVASDERCQEVDTAGNYNIHGEMGGKIFKLLSELYSFSTLKLGRL